MPPTSPNLANNARAGCRLWSPVFLAALPSSATTTITKAKRRAIIRPMPRSDWRAATLRLWFGWRASRQPMKKVTKRPKSTCAKPAASCSPLARFSASCSPWGPRPKSGRNENRSNHCQKPSPCRSSMSVQTPRACRCAKKNSRGGRASNPTAAPKPAQPTWGAPSLSISVMKRAARSETTIRPPMFPA